MGRRFIIWLAMGLINMAVIANAQQSDSAAVHKDAMVPLFTWLSDNNVQVSDIDMLLKTISNAPEQTEFAFDDNRVFVSAMQREILVSHHEPSHYVLTSLQSNAMTQDVIKNAIAKFPHYAAPIIQLTLSMAPSDARNLLVASSMTGVVSYEEALEQAILAGVDPSEVSEATASGKNDVEVSVLPLGAQITREELKDTLLSN
ncbi:MAG: hypothetical protein Alis3KO_14710 [Aliiglaciecola sp.]